MNMNHALERPPAPWWKFGYVWLVIAGPAAVVLAGIATVWIALASPEMKNQTYIVADPAPLTLAKIVAALRAGEDRGPGLLPVPPALIAMAARAIGRDEEWQRLGGSLVADPTKLLEAGWRPKIETRAGLAALTRARR